MNRAITPRQLEFVAEQPAPRAGMQLRIKTNMWWGMLIILLATGFLAGSILLLEAGEKRNLIMVVAGAISAYTAAIFLLIGVTALIALGIQAAGLSPLLSVGLGAMAVFLLAGATGYLLVRKGVSALGESLLPEKTLQTLGKQTDPDPKVTLKDSRSSDEVQQQVESTQDVLGQDLDRLKARLMPKRLFGVFLADQIKQHPFRLLSLAASTLVTGFQIAKRLRKRAP